MPESCQPFTRPAVLPDAECIDFLKTMRCLILPNSTCLGEATCADINTASLQRWQLIRSLSLAPSHHKPPTLLG